MSTFEEYRRKFNPLLPKAIAGTSYKIVKGKNMPPVADGEQIAKLFPNTTNMPYISIEPTEDAIKAHEPVTVGVIFSGGQAPGGHNVLCGLYDKIMQIAPGSKLLGFQGGPLGLMKDKHIELTKEFLAKYRNMGGFHAIGSGRDKIATKEQFDMAAATAEKEHLDGLVIIGGDDSNTNACVLAEDFLKRGLKTKVIGVPKTIDRDLIGNGIETSFGFDTASKVYSELIGNLCYDALSAKKYWHFIRLMGRSASHITLECALQTHPNICMIGEEILANNWTSKQVFEYMANIIIDRAHAGKNYGICLIPEGLIEFIPENNKLFDYLNNKLLPSWKGEISSELVAAKLPEEYKETFLSIPPNIRTQLLLDRDPHGNIAISQIETEKFLVQGVKQVLKEREENIKFSPLYHFFGYEGRCAAPSAFDSSYCYGLGSVAAILLSNGITGYMSCLKNLAETPDKWVAGGLPLTSLMNVEMRHGEPTPVIMKQMVDLKGRPFCYLAIHRAQWASEDCYQQPGPIQLIATDDEDARRVVYQSSISLMEEARGL